MAASSKRTRRIKMREQDCKQNGHMRKAKKKMNDHFMQDDYIEEEQGRVIQGKFLKKRPAHLQPMTDAQSDYLESLRDNTITVASGHAGCVDSETEFLSQSGWKKISEYEDGDLVMQVSQMGLEATLVTPQRYIKEPCDWFYAIETERGSINQRLSPDHDVAYTVKSKTRLNKLNIEEVLERNQRCNQGFSGKVACVYDYADGNPIGLSEDMIRLGVALKADGSLRTEGTGYYVVRLKKKRKIERFTEILERLGYEYNIYDQPSTGFRVFSLYAKWCSKSLHDWMMCSKEDAQIIMDEYYHWDGGFNKIGNRERSFSTSVKKDADAMQYFGNICGFRTTIATQDRVGTPYQTNGNTYYRKSVEYTVHFSNQTHVSFLPLNNKTKEPTVPEKRMSLDGFKYCFTVPSGFLVLRRNDCVFVTGNCGKSYVATYRASELYHEGIVDKIVITRPYSHLGKDYGATPGSDFEKLEPFMRPMLDTLKKALGPGRYQYMLDKGIIEVAPLEKIQGRSFDEPCCIIADEMQNASRPQAVSLYTRLGEDVEFLAICGDPRQSVSRGYNTLDYIADFFERNEIDGVGIVHFTEDDCVRSGIVKDILIALEKEGGCYSDL